MLSEFIAVHRDDIIERCRAKVATRSLPPPTEAEIGQEVVKEHVRGDPGEVYIARMESVR